MNKKDEKERRSVYYGVRFTVEEFSEVKDFATVNRIRISEAIRSMMGFSATLKAVKKSENSVDTR